MLFLFLLPKPVGMEKDKTESEKERAKQTPIIDGDARPDIDLNPEDKPKDNIIPIPDKGKTTPNRNDANSLEDYKDER